MPSFSTALCSLLLPRVSTTHALKRSVALPFRSRSAEEVRGDLAEIGHANRTSVNAN